MKKNTKSTQTSLIKTLGRYGKVETTLTRAKSVQGQVDHLISLAKRGLAGRRRVVSALGDKRLSNIFVDEVALKFNHRTSGFTRIIKLGKRNGDGAMKVILEFVEPLDIFKPKPKTKPAIKEKDIPAQETVKEEKPKRKVRKKKE
ncbi:MAG: 50S ribosomal protein L17 [Candidatus Curtissbacteria bacterium]|nr:50S ribosomal protein L17 [Candidatus Curtissbacteria bacterium]